MSPDSRLRRMASAWTRFWFERTGPEALTWMRVAFGALMVVWAATVLPAAPLMFSEEGAAVTTTWATAPFAQLAARPAGAVAVVVVMLVAAVALMLGRAPRTAAIVVFLCITTVQAANPGVFNAGDRILRGLSFVIAISPLHRTPGLGRPVDTDVPRWPLRIPQLVLTTGYFSSVAHKLQGRSWPSGEAAANTFFIGDMARWAEYAPSLVEWTAVSVTMSWATLLVQASVPILLWWRRTRVPATVIGLGLHASIELVLVVGFFAPAMGLLYLSFLPPDTARRWTSFLRERLPGGSRSSPHRERSGAN